MSAREAQIEVELQKNGLTQFPMTLFAVNVIPGVTRNPVVVHPKRIAGE